MNPNWSQLNLEAPLNLNIRLARDSEIDARISGQVLKPETLNYRTFTPEKQGLYDEDIFGELSTEESRTELQIQRDHLREVFAPHDQPIPPSPLTTRFGVIELPIEIVHPLWMTRFIDQLESATGWTRAELREREASVIRERLEERDELTYVILDRILVIPARCRPFVTTEDGKIATGNLSDLYRRVLNRSNRLKRLIELDAPEIIILNERRMLNEAVDSLFDNGHPDVKCITSPRGRTLTPLLGFVQKPGALESLDSATLDSAMPYPSLCALRALEAMAFTVSRA